MAIILSIVGGLIVIATKSLNNAATKKLNFFPGSTVNYLTGTFFSLLFLLLLRQRIEIFDKIAEIPPYYFLGGLLGLLAMLASNYTLHRLPVMHSTTLIIALQMLTALYIDLFMFNKYSYLRTIGALIVVLALVWDQRIILEIKKKEALAEKISRGDRIE